MTSSARRHDSLIPLSREHQYALLLCLRIHRGLPEHGTDVNWIRTKAGHAVQFFESELVVHFQAEEEALFPPLRAVPDAVPIIDELLEQHNQMRRLCELLRELPEGSLGSTLKEFADLLESHIRKEERELFPIYEREASPDTIARVEHAIRRLIGSASKPRRPDLLA